MSRRAPAISTLESALADAAALLEDCGSPFGRHVRACADAVAAGSPVTAAQAYLELTRRLLGPEAGCGDEQEQLDALHHDAFAAATAVLRAANRNARFSTPTRITSPG